MLVSCGANCTDMSKRTCQNCDVTVMPVGSDVPKEYRLKFCLRTHVDEIQCSSASI